MTLPPLTSTFYAIDEIFKPYGDYLQQAWNYISLNGLDHTLFKQDPFVGTYEDALNQCRKEFEMAKKSNDDFGGLSFINYSPLSEHIERMQDLNLTYDVWSTWLFDLVENGYAWSWKLDRKNHCLQGQLSCTDEGSPNYKKMVIFRHRDPYKIQLMAYFYDSILTEGKWEGVATDLISW